jgi:ribosome-associated translation inhibitor RaiA
MQIPLQISFENSEPSEAIRAVIGQEVERLEKYQHHITGCRVAVVAPSTKHRHGAVYRIGDREPNGLHPTCSVALLRSKQ